MKRTCVAALTRPVRARCALSRARSFLCALALTCALAFAVRADDSRYQDFPVGSRATALGGAFVAISDDPSGLFYNPAGICDARRLDVSVSTSLYGIERQSEGSAPLANRGTFSLGTLSTLNVIPGEAGLIKGVGNVDTRGTPWAFGFEVTVPSFRSTGTDTANLTQQIHSRIDDRTFDAATGFGFRYNERLNFGFALHYVLRLFDQTDDALVLQPASGGAGSAGVEGRGAGLAESSDTGFASYHAQTQFQHSNLLAVAGVKARLTDRWLLGAALGAPSLHLMTQGSVQVQDVVARPQGPPGSRTQIVLVQDNQIGGNTRTPLLVRAGAAYVEPHRYTLSGQLTFHGPIQYDRLVIAPEVERRLRLQDHIDRGPVLNANVGGEYLVGSGYSVAVGLFTDRSAAPAIAADASGKLLPGASRIDDISLYGGTATVGLIDSHAIARLGVSLAYGSGDVAQPSDPTGVYNLDTYTRVAARQLFLYFFLATTFRY